MDAKHWQDIRAYMALSDAQREAADRAEYPYLPTVGLLESRGYTQEFLALWQYRPPGLKWPLYEVAFYSKTSCCRLSYSEQPAGGWQRTVGALVASDAQLLLLLQANQFPHELTPIL